MLTPSAILHWRDQPLCMAACLAFQTSHAKHVSTCFIALVNYEKMKNNYTLKICDIGWFLTFQIFPEIPTVVYMFSNSMCNGRVVRWLCCHFAYKYFSLFFHIVSLVQTRNNFNAIYSVQPQMSQITLSTMVACGIKALEEAPS